ncbi:MAG: hypothetical protein P8X75_08890, partial [Limibacillus sp.]
YDPRKKPSLFAVYASILFGLLQVLPPIAYALWLKITDDGHGIYTAPEDIEPAPVLTEPWPPIDPAAAMPGGALPRMSRADLPTYFFPQGATLPENGQALWRFDGSLVSVSARSKNKAADLALVALVDEILEAAGLPLDVMPKFSKDGRRNVDEDVDEIAGYLAIKEYKEGHRDPSLWQPEGPAGERMAQNGCAVRHRLPRPGFMDENFTPPRTAYAIDTAFIATYHRLDEPTVDHCLFKALLVALGLHPTEGFFFKEGPVTPEEQARALAALALVYHPAVEPGMTEQAFTAALLEHDLIDP